MTKEDFFAAVKKEAREIELPNLGRVKYRFASVADKAAARRYATHNGELNSEEFEAALVARCLVEPQLSEMDIPQIMQLPCVDINILASEIAGVQSPKKS